MKRKAQKQLAIGHTENRNEQFENIKRLKEEYNNIGEPIISIDRKKRVYWQPLSRREALHKRSKRDFRP